MVAIFALAASSPTSESLLLGGLAALPALWLRAWAFAHLGGRGRTRDPAPPAGRVRGGPYGWATHPVYVANVGLAAAMLVAGRPAVAFSAPLLALVAGFYAVLGARESAQLVSLPTVDRPPDWRSVPRWERSTWATTAAWFVALAIRLG